MHYDSNPDIINIRQRLFEAARRAARMQETAPRHIGWVPPHALPSPFAVHSLAGALRDEFVHPLQSTPRAPSQG